jgi:RNA polymerase sigma-70 factor (ECF subfamily)
VNTQLKNLNDEELVFIYRSKKTSEALGILYHRYAHLVYGVCMKYLKNQDNANDATMQIFEKLITDLPKYDVQVFKAWIYRVAQNHCFMILRNTNHNVKLVDEFPEYSMEYDDNMHPVLEKEKMLVQMEEALIDLNEDQRRCVTLFYLEKKTYTEIMLETGFNFMQVKSFIQNGKRNLKLKLNENITNE